MDGATTSIFPWPQVLTMNKDTVMKLHREHYKNNDPFEWESQYDDGSLTGTQIHHGKIDFNPDPNVFPVNEVVGYTFKLSDGTITLGNPPKEKTFIEWNFLLYVVPEASEYYPINLKTSSSASILQFAPNTTQKPDPAELEKDAGWPSGTIAKHLKYDVIAGLVKPDTIPLGLSIGCSSFEAEGPSYYMTPKTFVPLAMLQGDPNEVAPLDTTCYFGVYVVTMDGTRGPYQALKGEVFNLSGETAKLTIGYDRFWNDWFLKALRPVVKNVEVYPNWLDYPGDNSYRIGYNPDHPNIDDKFYDFSLDIDHESKAFCCSWWSEFRNDEGLAETTVDVFADLLGSRINVYFDWVFSWGNNNTWGFECSITYGVTQFSSETGGITVEQDGEIEYYTHPNSGDGPGDALTSLRSVIDNSMPSLLDDFLETLQNIDKLYDPGFDRFHAVNPVFADGNLVIEMNINGADVSGKIVRQKPLPAYDAKAVLAQHREIGKRLKELRKQKA